MAGNIHNFQEAISLSLKHGSKLSREAQNRIVLDAGTRVWSSRLCLLHACPLCGVPYNQLLLEPTTFPWSTSMLVFSGEVALEMSLRLERWVGPTSEICEAVSPTFSFLSFRTKAGTANPNIRKFRGDTRN